jgi:ferredoxin-type protein NapH
VYRPYRRASQLAVFTLMFLIPVLNSFEIYSVTGTFYAINVGGLGIADPAVILQAVFASGQLTTSLLTAALFPFIISLLFGRIWCGWMCPYHVLADASAWLSLKLRRKTGPKAIVCPSAFKANCIRYGFLAIGTGAAGAAAIPLLNFVNAPGIVSTEAMIFVKEHSVSLELGFIGGILALEMLVFPRFWCRLFCPTGAVVSLFRTPFTLRVSSGTKVLGAPCCKEDSCSAACPMGLHPFRQGDDLLCTNCGRCIDACRTGRLKFTGFQHYQ